MPLGPSDRASREAGAVELAKVGFTSLVTSNSGVLIGLLAFASQAKVNGSSRPLLACSATFAALGLTLAILATILGYVSQLDYSNDGHAAHAAGFKRSAWTAVGSLAALALSLVCGGIMLWIS